MARQKKDGVHVNMYLSRQVWDQLKDYAEEKGQSLTTAVERILAEHLANEEKMIGKESDNVRH
ncbi:MAG: hypothetical protein IJI57_12210 [Flexilinea sp.]|nr:hypothetical protein [Flexilinea sp.]